jgi:hypothetical protein
MIYVPNMSSFNGAYTYTSSTTLPAKFIPNINAYCLFFWSNASSSNIGLMEVNTYGQLILSFPLGSPGISTYVYEPHTTYFTTAALS